MSVKVILHKHGETHEGEVKDKANLVVQAAIRKFPYPHLSYLCGMGRCGTCACKVLKGAEFLPEPNAKEKARLGDRVNDNHRLMCQVWITEEIELSQDIEAGQADKEYQRYLEKQSKQ